MAFSIDIRFTRPLAVLKVRGELDLATMEHVGCGVAEASDKGCRLVTLDLAAVTFIDCAAIGALVEAKRRVEGDGGRLSLHGMSPQVVRMLDLTCMTAFFTEESGSSTTTSEPRLSLAGRIASPSRL